MDGDVWVYPYCFVSLVVPSPSISPMGEKLLPSLLCSMVYFSLLIWYATDQIIWDSPFFIMTIGEESHLTGSGDCMQTSLSESQVTGQPGSSLKILILQVPTKFGLILITSPLSNSTLPSISMTPFL